MAINFPSSPTSGDTHTAGGVVYTYDGTSWTGSSIVTESSIDATLNTSTATNNQVLSWDGSDYAWIAQTTEYGDTNVDAHLNTSTATSDQMLSWNGTDYDWVTQNVAFSSLTGTPTTLSGYGITDAPTSAGANGQFNVSDGSGGFRIVSLYSGQGGNGQIGVGSGSQNQLSSYGLVVFRTGSGNIAKFNCQAATGLVAFESSTTSNQNVAIKSNSNRMTLVSNGNDYAMPTADGTNGQVLTTDGSGSLSFTDGVPSRSTATGTTSSLADGAEANLDITGFKSYVLLAITTDRAARVRLYVNDATRTADSSRAEGTDPASNAGLIAEVITTSADTVIISPGAYGFNLESTPTTTIPCIVTNKSGSASTVEIDLNILQLEA